MKRDPAKTREALRAVDNQAAPVQPANDETGVIKARRASGLTVRIALGFGVMTLVFSLILGLLASQLISVLGLSPRDAAVVNSYVLWWGLGAVLVSGLLGMLIARQIGEPIRRLTEELSLGETRHYPWIASVYHEYAELEQLSQTIRGLAKSVGQRELELSTSEQKFREAFDLVGVGLVQVDTDGRFQIVNRRFCEMLGYSRNELVGRRFIDVTHPEDRPSEELLLREAAAGKDTPLKREKRYLRKDGSVVWAQRSGVLVRDVEGRVMYGLGSIEDVSEYHASQETLRALNASLKAIVESSPLAIYSVTPAGIVTLWNPAAEKMFGLREAEVLGKRSPLFTNGNIELGSDIRARVLAGETIHNHEVTRVHPGGLPMEISYAAAPLRGPNHEVVGILATCTDITAIKRTASALGDQLRFTQELLEVIPNPIFYSDREGRYLGFNLAWEKFFGRKREAFFGRRVGDLLPPSLAIASTQRDQQVIETGEMVIGEVQLQNAGGETRQILEHVSRFTNREGRAAGTIRLLTDITDFKQVEQALQASERRFQALTESAMDIVTVLNADGIIIYQSPSVRHLLGFDPMDMLGRSQFEMVHREDVGMLRERFRELVQDGAMQQAAEFRVRHKDGTWRTLESIGKNCLDVPAVSGVIVNTRDVTERKQIQQRIQHLAYHDALTGLPNRSLMQDRISQTISYAERSGKRLAVMFIDLDNFKNINDTLGHDVGDELLRQMSQRLTRSVRAHDTIARQGGDEFIVLLDQLDNHVGASKVAQNILEALRAPFQLGGSDQHISGSIGIALYPEDGRDPPTLLKNADTAMFHGKSLGKNTYQFFTSQMNIAVKRRAVLESSLRAAVQNGDFTLVYQPQIDLNTGAMVAVEALVRWVSADSGTMMPGEFIPLAEETGLISELGRWVLHESCRQNKKWLDQGLPPRRVAVNLSARQLNDKGFVDSLEYILNDTGLDPSLLELEITESQVMRQGEGSVQLLNEIADMGVHIAVDDFGTGYSSLSYLKRLPIGKLKIDQSFIRDITVDPNDTAIVVAIINMAKSLDLEIIAEGIETAGQLTLLRAKGCGVGQGFYFSVPLSPEDLAPLLVKRSLLAPVSMASD